MNVVVLQSQCDLYFFFFCPPIKTVFEKKKYEHENLLIKKMNVYLLCSVRLEW